MVRGVSAAGALTLVAVVTLGATLGIATPASAGPIRPLAGVCQPKVRLDNPLQEKPWALRRLQPERVWSLTRGAGVTVAVIDAGVSKDHPLLADKVLPGADLLNGADNGACDESPKGHGTLVGAIIAARDGKEPLYYGMAPDAMILPFRVLPDSEKTNDQQAPERIAQAIRSAVDQQARVINLSLTTGNSEVVTSAVKYAQAHDVVLVAASGNESENRTSNGPNYPAAFPGVIAVGGIDQDGKHVKSSTTGAYVDVAAPGLEIVGPAPSGGGFGVLHEGGTSFAAPYVAGLAALIRAYYPTMTAPEVARRISETADHPAEGWNSEVGYGVINPYRAVTAMLPDASAKAARPVDTKGMPSMASPEDPMHRTRTIALIITGIGMVLALAIVLLRAAVRLGKSRNWRPGRRADGEGVPQPAAAEADAGKGSSANRVISPAVRRNPGAQQAAGGGHAAGRAGVPPVKARLAGNAVPPAAQRRR